ncbi:MAG: WD40 repeat domain-containing serine/threonine protein kinase [Phycisphaerales bacterium]
MPDPSVPPSIRRDCLLQDEVELIAAGAEAAEDARLHADSCAACRRRIDAAAESIRFVCDYAESTAPRIDSAAATRPVPEHEPAGNDLDVSPDLVPGYRIVAPLHAGGQGVVYRAIDLQTQRNVAIKMLLTGRFATPEQVRRFEREAEIASSLDHPNVVTIYHMLRLRGGRYAIVMEFIDGCTLDRWDAPAPSTGASARRHARRRLESLVRLFVGACDGVQHAHSRGALHQDLKPSNILVKGRGHQAVAKVVDFGMARPIRPDATAITRHGQFGGTIRYASPERLLAASDAAMRPDVRSDVYSLGVILYEMLCGRWPYEHAGSIISELHAIERCEPMPPSTFNHAIDRDLCTIILTAMHKDPRRRYDSAGALARDLRRWLAGEAVEARRDSGLYQLRKAARRYRVPLGIAGVLLVAGSLLMLQSFRLRNAALRAANAELLTRLNSARADSTSRDTDIMESRLRAARRGDAGAEPALWRIIFETYDRSAPDDPVSLANRDRIRRDALWALREHYARDPCIATVRLPSAPTAALLTDEPALLWLDADGHPHSLRLPSLQESALAVEQREHARSALSAAAPLGPAHGGQSGPVRFDPASARLRYRVPATADERDLIGHSAPLIFASALSGPGGETRWLVSIDEDRVAKVWRADEPLPASATPAHDGPIRSVWFEPDGLARSFAADGSVRAWRLVPTGLRPAEAPAWPIGASTTSSLKRAVAHAVRPQTDSVAIADSTGRLSLVHADTGESLWSVSGLGITPPPAPRSVLPSTITALAWSPEGAVLGASTPDGRISQWGADGSAVVAPTFLTAAGPCRSTVTAVGLEPSGERFVVGTSDGRITVGKPGTAWWPEFAIADEAVVAILTSRPDVHVVVTPRSVVIMDAACDGRELLRIATPSDRAMTCASLAPDGRSLLAGTDRGGLVLLDLHASDECLAGNLDHQLSLHAASPSARSSLDLEALRTWIDGGIADR